MRQPVPFGKYLLLDRISVGGMAEVFKAKSYGVEGFEKIIAIKRILPTMGEDRDFIKMFIDEAKIAGQLAHANICQIFELGRIDGSHFIAMEYIWGKDLLQVQNRLRKLKQPMPIVMGCFMIAKVLEGLDYAHRKKDPLGRPLEIVHRDCSPQNVLISYEGEVKVIDFGIAKATSRNSRTMAGVLKGKFGYMSPEQVRGLPLDRRSDIFALGTMLYECLTSERLFQGETDFSTLEKVRNVDIRPPRGINPNIPDEVERIILKALARDVDDRYQWCSEMLADLQQFLMNQEVVSTAKTLSGWAKEMFSPEIERERALLEQYKRVGRDGLIAGVPSAEAKLDVVENLGEAGEAADPTMLGGPNFDDVEGAPSEAGPALGSPASRAPDPVPAAAAQDREDFGEEAPTEIFGEIDGPGAAPPAAAAGPARGAPSTLAPPATKPPKPPPIAPPGRTPGARPAEPSPAASFGSATPAVTSGAVPPPRTAAPPLAAQLGFDAPPSAPPYGSQPGHLAPSATPSQGLPHGTPSHPQPVASPIDGPGEPAYGQPQQPLLYDPNTGQPLYGAPPSGDQPARTLIGMSAPPGLPNYSQGYPQQPQQLQYPAPPQSPYASGQQPQYPGQQPQYSTGQQPQYPGQQGYPSPSPYQGQAGQLQPGQPGQMNQGYPQVGQMQGYQGQGGMPPSGEYGAPNPSMEPALMAPETRSRRSSLGRDIAIGIGIAVVVLVAVIVIKLFVLDKGSPAPASASSSMATIRIAIPTDVTADLVVNGTKIATVSGTQEVPLGAGSRKVRLQTANGASCEKQIDLLAGKTTAFDCPLTGGTAGSAGSANGSNAGSATAGSNAAAGSATGSAAANGSNATPMVAAGSNAATAPAAGSNATPTVVAAGSGSNAAAAPTPNPMPAVAITPTTPAPTPTTPTPTPPVKPTSPVIASKPTPSHVDRMPAEEPAHKPTPAVKPAETTAPASSGAKGYLQVFSTPSARVLVDGVDTGKVTPLSGPNRVVLSPGKHKITLVVGDDKTTLTEMISAGVTNTLSKNMQQ